MANLETYFNNSQPLDEYIDSMTVNKDNVLTIYNAFTLPSSDDRINQLKDSSYSKVLVISEDWCGDAMMNLPILKRISESLQLEVRVFHRDEDTNLIDQYLTNGTARSIPIFIFMNDQFEQVSVWGLELVKPKNLLLNLELKNYHLKMHTIMRIKKKKYIMKSLLNINQILTYGIKFMTL